MKRTVSAWRRLTAPFRALPHGVVIGGMKCGTTTLYYRLKDHPDFLPPVRKEVHFFDRNYHRGIRWYQAHFPIVREVGHPERKTVEASPYYLIHPHTPSRIAKWMPKVRLVALLRDPVSRAYSHYQQICRMGWETLSFEDAIAAEEERIGPDLERMLADPLYHGDTFRRYSYLARGRYAEQLERWMQFYGPDQLMIVRTEDLAQQTDAVFGEILAFLGLRPWSVRNVPNRRVASYDPIQPATRERLREYFAPHTRRLEQLVGRDFCW